MARLPVRARARPRARCARWTSSARWRGPAFRALRPAVRRLDAANSELRPLAEKAEPILRKSVRPFVRRARPYIARPPARPRATSAPPAPTCASRFFELNRFFNMAAYNPGGAEGLTGDAPAGPRARRGAALLARLGLPQHQLAVPDQRRLGPATGASSSSPPAPPTSSRCSTTAPRRRIVEDAARREGPARRHGALPALMIKDTPSLGRMAAMAGFTLSCFGAADLPVAVLRRLDPAAPRGLPLRGGLPRGSLLVKEADVRIAGLNVGKVKDKRLDAENGDHDRRAGDRREVRADPARHEGAAADQGAAGRDLRGAHARHGRRADARRRRAAARQRRSRRRWRSTRSSRSSTRPTRRNFQGWIRELATRDRQGPRRGPQRRDRQPAPVRGQRRRRARGARRPGAGGARAGAQLRPRRWTR